MILFPFCAFLCVPRERERARERLGSKRGERKWRERKREREREREKEEQTDKSLLSVFLVTDPDHPVWSSGNQACHTE